MNLVTVRNREFYIYRYEGHLNDVEHAVVLLSYPKEAFGQAKALRAFISTNTELSTQEILDTHTERWDIELFFRESKQKLAFGKYQIRSQMGIERYWLIMSLVHYMCCTYNGSYCSFEDGYQYFKQTIREEQVTTIFYSVKNGMSLKKLLALVG